MFSLDLNKYFLIVIGRRVIGHLKNQQWTAFGIEFVIVVLGIFIGLRVSNWNQERTVDQQAAKFAERLKTDLREEDWAYQLQITYSREVLANAERAASALDIVGLRSGWGQTPMVRLDAKCAKCDAAG